MDFALHTRENATDSRLEALERANEAFGMVPNLIATMAESPATAQAYLDLHDAFGRSSFTPVEQQVVALTVSRIHECTYCMAAESAAAGMVGMGDDLLAQLRSGERPADARTAALIDFTTAVVEARGLTGDDAVADFVSAGFTQAQVLEVVLGVAKKVMSNYINHLAGTPLDAPFQTMAWEPASTTTG